MSGISGWGASSVSSLAKYFTNQNAAGSSANLIELLQQQAQCADPAAADPAAPHALDPAQLSANQGLAVYLHSANVAAQNLTDMVQNGAFARVSTTSSQSAIQATASSNAARISYSLGVTALAQGQAVDSDAMDPGSTPVSPGTYSFEVRSGTNEQGMTTTPMQFQVPAGASAQSVLGQLVGAINSAGTGSTASLVTDAQGQVRLRITNNLQGQGATVALGDTAGGLMTRLGLTNTSAATGASGGTARAAQSAAYTVNGTAYTSNENFATLNDGKVRLAFTATTQGSATVTVGNDTQAFVGALGKVVAAFNDAAGFAKSAGAKYSAGLLSQLKASAAGFQSTLGAAGVTFNADGTMGLDSPKLAAAVAAHPASMASLAGTLGKFTQQTLGALTQQNSNSISSYLAGLQMANQGADNPFMSAYGGSAGAQPLSTLSTWG